MLATLSDVAVLFLQLIGVFIMTSFPPIIGSVSDQAPLGPLTDLLVDCLTHRYSTANTICGFAYGLQNGFILAIVGTLVGSMVSFTWATLYDSLTQLINHYDSSVNRVARLFLVRFAEKMLEQQASFRALGHAVVRGHIVLSIQKQQPGLNYYTFIVLSRRRMGLV